MIPEKPHNRLLHPNKLRNAVVKQKHDCVGKAMGRVTGSNTAGGNAARTTLKEGNLAVSFEIKIAGGL